MTNGRMWREVAQCYGVATASVRKDEVTGREERGVSTIRNVGWL